MNLLYGVLILLLAAIVLYSLIQANLYLYHKQLKHQPKPKEVKSQRGKQQ